MHRVFYQNQCFENDNMEAAIAWPIVIEEHVFSSSKLVIAIGVVFVEKKQTGANVYAIVWAWHCVRKEK